MERIPKARLALVGLLTLVLTVPAFGQEDERLLELAGKMKAELEAGTSMHTVTDMRYDVNNGAWTYSMLVDMWQDRDSMRVDWPEAHTVAIATPSEFYIHDGRFGITIYAPLETMAEITQRHAEILRRLGFAADNSEMLISLIELGALDIIGEETVDGHECYSVEADLTMAQAIEELGKTFVPVESQDPSENIELYGLSLAFDKAEGVWRRMDVEMSMPADPQDPNANTVIAISMSLEFLDVGMEIPGELLEFEVPDDEAVVLWTKDKTADQIATEYRAAMRRALQGGVRGGVQ